MKTKLKFTICPFPNNKMHWCKIRITVHLTRGVRPLFLRIAYVSRVRVPVSAFRSTTRTQPESVRPEALDKDIVP